jgi:hypothetical protein
MMRWAGYAVCMGEMRTACAILVESSEGKRPLGVHRSRWKNNNKMDPIERGYEDVYCIDLAQDRNE